MVDKKNKKKKKFAVSDVTQADGSNNDIVIEAEDEHAEGQARC